MFRAVIDLIVAMLERGSAWDRRRRRGVWSDFPAHRRVLPQ